MLQAEVGGATVAAAGEKPRIGQRLREFALPSSEGKLVQLSEFRGRSSLALLLAGTAGLETDFLARLATSAALLEQEEGRVLIVGMASLSEAQRSLGRNPLPFTVLVDTDGRIHRMLAALPDRLGAGAALYITDRFGEIFALWRTADGQTLPQPEEILEWFRYIGRLCPECAPPEWPKE